MFLYNFKSHGAKKKDSSDTMCIELYFHWSPQMSDFGTKQLSFFSKENNSQIAKIQIAKMSRLFLQGFNPKQKSNNELQKLQISCQNNNIKTAFYELHIVSCEWETV